MATVRVYKFFRDRTLAKAGVVLEGEIGENEKVMSVEIDADPSSSVVLVTTVEYSRVYDNA